MRQRRYLMHFLFGGLLLAGVLGRALPAGAVSWTLGWDTPLDSTGNPDATVTGYRLYLGLRSNTFVRVITLGLVTTTTITDGSPGETYTARITALWADGTESVFSNEVSATLSAPAAPGGALMVENAFLTQEVRAPALVATSDALLTIAGVHDAVVRGSLVYLPASAVADSRVLTAVGAGTPTTGQTRRTTLSNLGSVAAPTVAGFSTLAAFDLAPLPAPGSLLTAVVGVTGLPGSCATGSWASCANIAWGTTLTAALGATSPWVAMPGLCTQVINGSTTSVPLWPWPMNQRILDAMTQAGTGRTPVDVQAQLTSTALLGPLPASCLSGGGTPVATSLSWEEGQPPGGLINVDMTPPPVVRVNDQFGAVFPTTAAITLTLLDNEEGATLTGPACSGGTCVLAASGGRATFSGMRLDLAGSYRLQASTPGLPAMPSGSFTMTQPGNIATKLQFQVQPGPALVGSVLTPAPAVQPTDDDGVLFTASPVTMTLYPVPAARRLSLPAGANKRYFVDPDGRPVFLTGSHTWNNLQDGDNYETFDWTRYLASFTTAWGTAPSSGYQPRHNAIRLWANEHWEYGRYYPNPFLKDGPGTDQGGLPGTWDFSAGGDCAAVTVGSTIRFDPAYFTRLRDRVLTARDQGIYVIVVLFQSWSTWDHGGNDPYPYHWYNPANNCNGVDGSGGSPSGIEIETLTHPVVTYIQEQYVKHVIDTLHDLDNVLWEISNEASYRSLDWQNHMVTVIRDYETATYPLEPHLVGISSFGDPNPGGNATYYGSSAEWVGVPEDPSNPLVTLTTKPNLSDTDHQSSGETIQERGRDLWRLFTRGNGGVLLMDGFNGALYADPGTDATRRAEGGLWAFSQRVDLLTMTPQDGGTSPSSTGYCLYTTSDPSAYLVYQPNGGSSVTFSAVSAGTYTVTWFNLDTGTFTTQANRTYPGAALTLAPPPGGPTRGWGLLLRETTVGPELVLGGTTTRTTSAGTATFSDLTLPRTGTAHLWATAPPLTSSMSQPFAISDTTPTATALTLVAPIPTTAVQNVAASPALVVQVVDQGGTPFVPSPALSVSLVHTSGPGTCTGLGPVTTNLTTGRATFSAITCDTVGTVVLRPESAGLTSAPTVALAITAAPLVATKLGFRQQPGPTYQDTILAPPITVELQNVDGLLVTDASATVTVALTTPAGAILSGDVAKPTTGGVATFSDLAVDKVGTYTLTASATGLTPATSTSFAITMIPTTAVLLDWPMTEGAGTVLNDHGATGLYDGTFGAGGQAPTWVAGPLAGTQGLRFVAANTQLVQNTAFPWAANEPVTVVLWVKRNACDSVALWCGLLQVGTPNVPTQVFGAHLLRGDVLIWQYGNTETGDTGASWVWTPALTTAWIRLGLVATGSLGTEQSIYVNGQRVATLASNAAPSVPLTGMTLGMHNPAGTERWGDMDVAGLRIQNRYSTPAEMLADYVQASTPGVLTGSPSSMLLGR